MAGPGLARLEDLQKMLKARGLLPAEDCPDEPGSGRDRKCIDFQLKSIEKVMISSAGADPGEPG